MMKRFLPLLLSVLCMFVSCTKDGPSKINIDPKNNLPEDNFFDTSNSLSGDAYGTAAAKTLMRALELCYSMEENTVSVRGEVIHYSMPSNVNNAFVDDFYKTLQQLAYSPDAVTKGFWSIGKSLIDWNKALANTNTVFRCAIVGVASQELDKDQMTDIYNQIMKNKKDIFRDWGGLTYVSDEFEQEFFSSCGRFWYHFSNGNLDKYAKKIYNTILNPQTLSDCGVMTDGLHELAFELANRDLTPNRLMLSAAGPLLEAGFNTIFAADDIAGYAKLGYDILNDNTKLIVDFKNGKLNTKTLMTAVNTNLGVLTTCIDKIISLDALTGIKDTQDLGSLISSYCVEKGLDVDIVIRDLNNAISESLTTMGKFNLKVNDIEYEFFEKSVQEILGITKQEYKCTSIDVLLKIYPHIVTEEGSGGSRETFSWTMKDIQLQMVNDTTLQIEATYNEKKDSYTYNHRLYCEIIGFDPDDMSDCKMSTCTIEYNEEDDMGYLKTTKTFSIEVENIKNASMRSPSILYIHNNLDDVLKSFTYENNTINNGISGSTTHYYNKQSSSNKIELTFTIQK